MPARLPLAGLRFSLTGPGRVGASVASWAVARGAELVAVAARRPAAAAALAAELGGEAATLTTLRSAGQDLLLVAVADQVLAEVSETLAARPQAAIALHTSGSRGAEAIAALRRAGCAVGSLHPLRAFPGRLLDPEAARGVLFALDGDPAALGLARRLAAAWRADTAEVDGSARPLYHLAASLAAGGTVTLLAACAEIAERLGLPAAVAAGYVRLAIGALEQAASAAAPGLALTGPAARGDSALLRSQVAALREAVPDLAGLTLLLARETLRQQERARPLTAAAEALAGQLSAVGISPDQIRSFVDREGTGC